MQFRMVSNIFQLKLKLPSACCFFYQLLIFRYRSHYNTLLERKSMKLKGERLSLTCKKDKKVTANYDYRKSQAVTLLSVLFFKKSC